MRPARFFAIALAAVSVSACPLGNQPVELTGVAVERGSGKPMAGVWVLAPYHEFRTDNVVIAVQDCVKTRGMMTGEDGKFHFPVEKRDGMSPAIVFGIAPGYYMYTLHMPTPEQWRRHDKQSYSNFEIIMEKQDPAHPVFLNEADRFCHWATRSEDVVAANRYLEIELEDVKRYGGRPGEAEMLQRVIDEHQALGSKRHQ